jgi:pimeloyl-ACP methyl ester carboxylesterase
MHAGAVEIHTLDGVSVTTRRWDPQRNGHVGAQAASPLLLVHGLGANTVSWLPVGQALADRRNGPVIALDLAGFGYTRAVGTNATIQRNAGLVVAALEEFGPSVVFGNSMGGVIATKVSALRPDLVQGLVLVNPALRPVFGSPQWRQAWLLSPMVFPRVGTRVIGGRATQLGAEGMVDGTLRLVLEDPTALDPRIREDFVTIATDRGAYPEAARAYADAASSMFWYLVRNFDRDLALTLQRHPGLMIFGDRDRLVHLSSAHALSARHPDLDVAILEGIGHAPQLEAPALFVDVVCEWLGDRYLDQAD